MSTEDGNEHHPIRLLETVTGNPEVGLRIILARSGVGKSAALINFAIDAIQNGQHVLHFCAGMTSERVHDYYQEIFTHYQKNSSVPNGFNWHDLYHHFLVVSYRDPQKMVASLEDEIQTILDSTHLKLGLILVDGVDFDDNTQDQLKIINGATERFGVNTIASLRIHRNRDGEVAIDAPVESALPYSEHVYFLEPAREHIKIDWMTSSGPQDLPIYFCPQELVFRAS